MHDEEHKLSESISLLTRVLREILEWNAHNNQKIIHRIEERLNIMATKQDLDAAIAALPLAVETAVEAALAPVIAAIIASNGAVELQPEIDQLNALAGTVSAKIAADLTPKGAVTLDAIADLPVAKDAGIQTVGIAGISTTAKGATLSVTSVSSNTDVVPNPDVVYTNPDPSGSISFTPVASQTGVSAVTVTVTDGTSKAARVFTVTVS
jgi:hypothetical protein